MDEAEAYTSPFDSAGDGLAPFFTSGRGFIEEPRTPAVPLLPDLGAVQVSTFAERECEPRPWLVRDVIPDRQVTSLNGDGGTGKSLLALQLAVAVASGRDWLGMLPEQGGVVYLSAEDDINEVHRRLVDILAFGEVRFADLADFHLVPLAGRDAVLAMPAPRSEIVTPTRLWGALAEKIRAVRPRLVVVDNLADTFAGNENSRPQARQFVGLLRALAIECDHACMLLSHPSLTGISSGAGTSGSTAWSNSVRSRLYLDRVKQDGDERDPDLRVIRTMKTNYAAVGAEVRIRWDQGRFRLDGREGNSAFDRASSEQRAEVVFVALLRRFVSEGREVSHKRSPSYAPAIFAKQPDCERCSKSSLERAMEKLLASKVIRIETYGPPSRSYSRISFGEAS